MSIKCFKSVVKVSRGGTFIEVLLSMVVLGGTLVGSQFAMLSSMRYLTGVYQDGHYLRETSSQNAAQEIRGG